MKIKSGERTLNINTTSNWPMLVDLFIKWGFEEEALEEARNSDEALLTVDDLNKVVDELSAWGIPWNRTGEYNAVN